MKGLFKMNTVMKFALIATAVVYSVTAVAQRTNQPVKVRIKDVARIAGDDEVFTLVGYGVVAGLNKSGDSDKILIQRTISNLMQNFNNIVDENDIKAQNSAAVMVTATIRGSKRKGDMVEAEVSSIGDCKSLLGGVLLLTPLLGADGETWGIAQGPITTGGFSFGSSSAAEGGNLVMKNHPTSGMLTNGVKLLRNIGISYKNTDILKYHLRKPDFTSSVNMARTINKEFFGVAIAEDDATVKVRIPRKYKEEDKITTFVSEIEQLYFDTDSVAKVVFNERTGTIVMGADVRISSAAVSHGNLYVNIKNVQGVSQPGAFTESAGAKTEKIYDQTTSATEDASKVFALPNITTVGELVRVLNALGVTSRDIIIIFHCLKQAGALHAELEAM
jgi:flagellar P-ring protein precursor FlgI